MTPEQNVPEVQSHQGSPIAAGPQDGDVQFAGQTVSPGMGQSKSSRRRRRKRKNKGADAAPQAFGEQAEGQPVGSVQAASVPAPQPQGQQNYQGGGQGQQNGNSGKRWKKKFRDRDRQRSQDNIGNVASPGNGGGYRDRDSHQPGNNGFKRKGGKQQQQRGPRSFVGPMDHSYRAVNGNYADAPPSTIETGAFHSRGRGGYQGDSQPIDYSIGRAIPIPEDAPTRIFFFIEDLFITAKIQETARKLGVKVAFVKNDKESIAQLTGGKEEDRPGLIVFDLNNANAKPLTLIPKLKAKLKRGTSIVGFLSHLQGDLKAKATEAGCDTVMPRSAFSQNLPNLLRRYGIEEEDEPNFNQ
ncbi:MAG TPA: response regulator [Edaphobacter sp.]|nr:response regulator [Edaphobacter sp.]